MRKVSLQMGSETLYRRGIWSSILMMTVLFTQLTAVEGRQPRERPVAIFSQDSPTDYPVEIGLLRCSVVKRYSPDRKYVARLVTEDAEVAYLFVSTASSAGDSNFASHTVPIVGDVHGCLWLPSCPHSIVYSTGGSDYGHGVLGLWNGRNHILTSAHNDSGEGYAITGYNVADDELLYDHWTWNVKSAAYLPVQHMWLAIGSIVKPHGPRRLR